MKIKTITEKTYEGKVTGHSVVMEDGTQGNLSDKDSDKDLKAGDEVTMVVKDYLSKAGKHSNLLTLKRAMFNSSTPPSPHPSIEPNLPVSDIKKARIEEMRYGVIVTLLDRTHELLHDAKVTESEAKEHMVTWVNVSWGLIDDIFSR